MREEFNVLLTAYGCPGGPSIEECLKNQSIEMNVVKVDTDNEVYGLDYDVKPWDDIGYIDDINEVIEMASIDVVLPCSTQELLPLSENRDKIKAKVVVNHPKVLENCIDKYASYKTLVDYAPEFICAPNEEMFIEACRKLNYPNFSVFVKPCIGNGSRGTYYIRNQIHYHEAIQKKVMNATTKNGFIETYKHSEWPDLLVMEYLPDTEYSVDCLCRDGELIVAIPRIRTKTKGGIAVDTVTVKHDKLIEICRKIVGRMGLSYAVNIQFKEDLHGVPKLLEINPRVAGGMCISDAAGVNMPYYAVLMALGLDLPYREFNPVWGTRMRRIWREIYTYE